MAFEKILVAYDGSAASEKALDIVEGITEIRPDINVIIVHVVRLFSTGTAAGGMDTMILDDVSEINEKLKDISERFPNVSHRLLKGTSPADLIVECAKNEGCDLIVMGSRGKGGVKGYLGSVSYAVTKESPITVMIAKES